MRFVNLINNPKIYFIFIGAVNTLSGILITNLYYYFFFNNLSFIIINILIYITNIIISFLNYKIFYFKNLEFKKLRAYKEFFKYNIQNILGLILFSILTFLLLEFLHWNKYLAINVVFLFLVIFNYIFLHKFTFKGITKN